MTVTPTADAPPSSGWSIWGSAFGGTSSLPGDDAPGSHDTNTDLVGLATGWTHALSSDASFGFAINGAEAPDDIALVTAGATFGLGSQTSLSARFDGEFGQDYTTYGGTLALTYSW